jgi:hypothetical protein
MKKIILLLAFVLMLSQASANQCYQETANISTACGGLATGSYTFTVDWINPQNVYDGNFNSYGHYTTVNLANYSVNYTKPPRAINATLTLKDELAEALGYNANLTIPKSCFDYSHIAITTISNSDGAITWYCRNSTGLVSLGLREGDGDLNVRLYEEGIYWIYDIGTYENNQTYNAFTSSFSSETFTYNFSYPSSIYNSILSYLVYDNTKYLGTLTGSGDNLLATATLQAPLVSSSENKSFYWEVILSNATGSYYFNSSFKNQTVQNLSIDDCTVNTNIVINYTIYDEDSLVILRNPPQNSTIEINFKIGNSTYYTNQSGKTSVSICTSNPINSSLSIDSEVKYYSDNYVTEYHNLQNYSIPPLTTINISLYDLLVTSSQEFLITFKNSNYLVVGDALIEIQRQYIPQGSFITVEIPKTDSQGRTIGHFVLNDVLYNIYVKKNGRTLAVYSNIRLYCATSECTLNLNEQADGNVINDMSKYLDVVYSTDYNEDTRVYLFQFTVDDSSSKNFNLTITNMNSVNKETICSTTLSASSGSLQCTIPSSYANKTLIATIYVDGVTLSTQQIRVAAIGTEMNKVKYILAFMLILTLVGMAATSGKAGATMVIGLVGLTLVGAMSLVDYGGFFAVSSAIIWIFIAGGILIWKIANKGGEESG